MEGEEKEEEKEEKEERRTAVRVMKTTVTTTAMCDVARVAPHRVAPAELRRLDVDGDAQNEIFRLRVWSMAAAVISPRSVVVRFGPKRPDMSVPVGTSVVGIKRMVQEREYIEPWDQILLQGGKVLLDDTAAVSDTEIHVAPQVKDVSVMARLWNGFVIDTAAEVSPSATVSELKRGLCDAMHATPLLASDSLVLSMNGKRLHNDKRLWQYGVGAAGCTVNVADPCIGLVLRVWTTWGLLSSSLTVVPSTATPAQLVDQLSSTDTYIAALKASIGVHADIHGIVLARDVPLTAQGIEDGSEVFLVVGDVDVRIHVDDRGRTHDLRVAGSMPMGELAAVVAKTMGISLPTRLQLRRWDGRQLVSSMPVTRVVASPLHIDARSGRLKLWVQLVPRTSSMQIYVRVLDSDGETTTLDVSQCETIKEVKQLIEDVEEIAADRQHLIFRGKQLEDDRTLRWYGIETDSTLYLALRPQGGMLHETVRAVVLCLYHRHDAFASLLVG